MPFDPKQVVYGGFKIVVKCIIDFEFITLITQCSIAASNWYICNFRHDILLVLLINKTILLQRRKKNRTVDMSQ